MENSRNFYQTKTFAMRIYDAYIPFDPTIFNADFKPPAAALVEKSWGTNEHSFWLRITQHGRFNGYIHPPAALLWQSLKNAINILNKTREKSWTRE